MNNIYAPEFQRNYGFWNEEEQQKICESVVAIAGVGGDGFQLGEKLARLGVGRIIVADPEVFEPENANRVPGATINTYGRKKADVFKENVLAINPDADVEVYQEGITLDNIESFMSSATLVFDETELTLPHLGTAIAREARKRGLPVAMVMNVGFAGQVTSFDPNSKYTFERVMGIPMGAPLDEVEQMNIDFTRCLPYIPKYSDLRTLRTVQSGASLPSIAPGVDVASALGQSEALKHIFKGANARKSPTWAPAFRWMDAYDHTSGITRFPRMSFLKHAVRAQMRESLGKTPRASYTPEDIIRRKRLETQK